MAAIENTRAEPLTESTDRGHGEKTEFATDNLKQRKTRKPDALRAGNASSATDETQIEHG
jgi:hypothetical protein